MFGFNCVNWLSVAMTCYSRYVSFKRKMFILAFDFRGFSPWLLAWVPFFEPVGQCIMVEMWDNLVVAKKLREKRAQGPNMPFKDVLWVA